MTDRNRAPMMALLFLVFLRASSGAAQEEPPLPVIVPAPAEQVPAEEAPPLPEIAAPPREQEPDLPPLPEMGLPEASVSLPGEPAGRSWSQYLDSRLERLPIPLHGFWEVRAGPRLVDDGTQSRSFTLGESRLRLESDPFTAGMQFGLKVDLLHDFVVRESRIELREANVAFSPVPFLDVKAGRQILTWGTGDLVFINDLFPKDYVSFFIGRDVEYLKAPSDAVKVSVFSHYANLDVVYTPRFDPDVFVTGKRLSYFNPLLGRRAGQDVRIRAKEPNRWFRDDEVAVRLYRTFDSYEVAGYAYRGFWKSPAGVDPAAGKFTFPRLDVLGASGRGPVGKGIGNVEFGWYSSRDDHGGDDALVRNSEWRFLLGYGQDLPRIAPEFSVGVQYYLEHMMDHGAYGRSLPPGQDAADENRHTLTLRLTKLLLNQDLRLELFTFYGLSDDDVHLRPHFGYDITDRWQIDGGANIFIGDEDHTQFAQFERDSNVYLGLRYSF